MGPMPLNSLILQDDIARMNDNLDKVRTGAKGIEEMLRQKKFSANREEVKRPCIEEKNGNKHIKMQKVSGSLGQQILY